MIQNQRRSSKFFSLLLVLVILMTTPISMIQAYALEDLPLGASGVTDSGAPPEEIASPSDVNPVEAPPADSDPPALQTQSVADPTALYEPIEETTKVCEIGGTQYATLDEALAVVKNDETIKLLKSFVYGKGIAVSAKTITFDVGTNTLNVINDAGAGLTVTGGGQVILTGEGKLNVTGTDYGVLAEGIGSKATVTNAIATAERSTGACADNGGWISVKGFASGAYYGVLSKGGDWTKNEYSYVVVDGDVSGNYGAQSLNGAGILVKGNAIGIDVGAQAQSNEMKLSHLYVNGNATGAYYGASASEGGVVTVYGKAISAYKDGVFAEMDGEVNVHGDVEGARYGAYALGNAAGKYGRIHIVGNVESKQTGAFTQYGGKIDIDGNVKGLNGSGAYCIGGSIFVGKDAQGYYSGVAASIRNSVIRVKGNVIATNADGIGAAIANYGGVEATTQYSGSIFIDGAIQSLGQYIRINDIHKDGTPASRDAVSGWDGYYSYSVVNSIPIEVRGTAFGTSVVYVQETAPETYPVTVSGGTGGGSYSKDQTVIVTVGSAPYGQRFKEWIITPAVTFAEGTNTTSTTVKFLMPAQEVTVVADYEAIPATVGSVSVYPDVASVEKGKTFQFSANVQGAYNPSQEVTWSVFGNQDTSTAISTSGWLSIADGETADTLTVRATSVADGSKSGTSTVTVTAVPVTYTITFNLNGGTHTGGGELTQTVAGGGTATAPTVSRSHYTFTGWDRAFTNVTSNLTVTATWSYNGGSSDSGGVSNGGGGSYVPEPPKSAISTEKQPDMPTMVKIGVPGTVKDGVLSATITEQMAKDTIKAAQDALKKSGKEVDGIALEFGITGFGGYTSLNATIEPGVMDQLKEAGVKFIKIGSAVLDMTLDTGAIAEIVRQSAGTVMVSARTQTKLSSAASVVIGSRPVFDITVSYQKNGKTEHITNFGKGTVTLGIAYKAASNETTGSLFGVYVNKNGKPRLLTKSSYVYGRLIFSRNRLSTYGVGYKVPTPAIADTVNHWAKDYIDFVVSRDLISGTSAIAFAPDTAITRATFLMALGKLSGAEVSIYKTSSFTDVKNSDPAMPYIEWAIKNKIVQGIGNSKFGPALSISRQDMAVIMQNYANATGYKLPVSVMAVTFSDGAKISTYAKNAVTAIQQAGVMQGKDSNTFNPQGITTRAEASAILRRFIELVIDEGTARGWVQNDSGQWYYFNADGSLAKSSTINGYEVDENGVRKSK